jgi:tRNA(adenine34) deaminase
VTGYSDAFEPAMRLALAQAVGLPGPDDVPVGAVILDEAGGVVGQGRNRRERDRDRGNRRDQAGGAIP